MPDEPTTFTGLDAQSLPPDSDRSRRARAELAADWWSEEKVMCRLAIDRDKLDQLIRERAMLSVWPIPSGARLFPTFQFDGNELRCETKELLHIISEYPVGRGWMEIEWLYAPQVRLDDERPSEVFTRDPGRVLAEARREFLEERFARW